MTQKFIPGPRQEKWLRDLETTKAKQGQDKLYNAATKGFCCLGRAAVTRGVRLGKLAGRAELSSFEQLEYVADSLGLRSSGGDADHNITDNFPACTTMNDTGWSFREIAKHLRRYARYYFTEPK